MSQDMKTMAVGQVRPSQLLWTYGPGALIDLPNLSVVTMGIDRWREELCPVVEEARLLAAVQEQLGSQVERLRMPPAIRDDGVSPFSAEAHQGVPVRPFPRYLRCVRCGLLGDASKGLFKIEEDPFRPEQTHFVHVGCEKAKGAKRNSDAVPARFMVACSNGHLDEFPWEWFVHGGPTECKGTLYFYESGASLQTENLFVRCNGCGRSRSLAQAFGKEGKKNLPKCRARHPHLDRFDEQCGEQARAVLLGATNGWFPITLSALAIPVKRGRLAGFIEDGWSDFKDTESVAELKGLLKGIAKAASMPGIEKFTPDEIWAAIEEKRGGDDEKPKGPIDIRGPEWDVLTDPSAPSDWPHYKSTLVQTPKGCASWIASVSLVERLREVNALIGFTRVEAPDESGGGDEDGPDRAPLGNGKPTWVPATEVHGEGIFIRFNEAAIAAWEKTKPVKAREELLMAGHRGWRNRRGLEPDKAWPGIRYAMLHTLSHLLIRELALSCGYSAASIRERIYATVDPAKPMAGILLYTAAADSDGTLGGLVELGKPDNLGPIIREALERAAICASDPLCSEHDPGKDQSIHAASCHACSFVAETSCEKGNRYLDRALIVPTFASKDASFIRAEVPNV